MTTNATNATTNANTNATTKVVVRWDNGLVSGEAGWVASLAGHHWPVEAAADDDDEEIAGEARRWAPSGIVPEGVSVEVDRSGAPEGSESASELRFELTEYTTAGGTYEAVGVSWEALEAYLGHRHGEGPGGEAGDDARLVAALIAAGAPEWVQDAPGGLDEWGWYLLRLREDDNA